MDDRSIRQATFSWLDEQTAIYGYCLDRTMLAEGFEFQSERVRLLGPQGIFKPKCLELPLSITTMAGGPYTDSFRPDGLLSYRYRGTDPNYRDNVGLRKCLGQRKPLVYLHGIEAGTYVPAWPVYIVGADDQTLTFTVAVDDALSLRQLDTMPMASSVQADSEIRRGYITRLARQRIHQQVFRERILQRTESNARCADLSTSCCLMRRTSCRTASPKASPSPATEFRSVNCITRLSTSIFWRSGLTM